MVIFSGTEIFILELFSPVLPNFELLNFFFYIVQSRYKLFIFTVIPLRVLINQMPASFLQTPYLLMFLNLAPLQSHHRGMETGARASAAPASFSFRVAMPCAHCGGGMGSQH